MSRQSKSALTCSMPCASRKMQAGKLQVNSASSPSLTFGVREVDDIILDKQVHLLNPWDSVHTEPLQGSLEPLVICSGDLVHRLLFSAKTISCCWTESLDKHSHGGDHSAYQSIVLRNLNVRFVFCMCRIQPFAQFPHIRSVLLLERL